MTAHTEAGGHERARIQARVYRAVDGYRWTIRSSARGQRIISESSEAYANKRAVFRGLLLTTGGEYTELFRIPDARTGGVYTQGVIVRPLPFGGLREEIFVEYVSGVTR